MSAKGNVKIILIVLGLAGNLVSGRGNAIHHFISIVVALLDPSNCGN